MKIFEVNFLSNPNLSNSEYVDYEELILKDYYIFCRKNFSWEKLLNQNCCEIVVLRDGMDVSYVRYTFSSNHNIHKSSVDLSY